MSNYPKTIHDTLISHYTELRSTTLVEKKEYSVESVAAFNGILRKITFQDAEMQSQRSAINRLLTCTHGQDVQDNPAYNFIRATKQWHLCLLGNTSLFSKVFNLDRSKVVVSYNQQGQHFELTLKGSVDEQGFQTPRAKRSNKKFVVHEKTSINQGDSWYSTDEELSTEFDSAKLNEEDYLRIAQQLSKNTKFCEIMLKSASKISREVQTRSLTEVPQETKEVLENVEVEVTETTA